jgi:hypothetical protein
VVLGIEYDMLEWTWQFLEEKLARLVTQISGILGKEEELREV